MDDDKAYTYKHARALGARMARLQGEVPGAVQAIDYERMHLAQFGGNPEYQQDVAMDKLDELLTLRRIVDTAREAIGAAALYVWERVAVDGASATDLAVDMGCHRNTINKHLRRGDVAIMAAMVERDTVTGYGGRDMLEAGGTMDRGVKVWRNGEEE